ncbi:hypothetical protein CRX67_03775 [Enterobacteriaceae bacterium A-F18]|nr:hypothetical protein CRX67_03775 [Enterobacteriaceae bacterium A-F18]
MKLIDLLVEKLPKCGGWPGAIPALVQNSSGYVYQAGGGDLLYCFRLADDWMNAEVTCEKYFDALRASAPRPGSLLQYGAVDDEWDGVGLPPVGCECEVAQPGQIIWDTFKVIAVESGTVFGFFNNGVSGAALTEDCWSFRPIRSEADKKRDEAIEAIASYALPYKCGADIYDAIAAGKIPGVRIE